jgi:signal peptidase I
MRTRGRGSRVSDRTEDIEADEKETSAPRSLLWSIGELVLMLLAAVALAWLLRTFVVEPYVIPSGSMIPTIQIGDQVLVNKYVYRLGTPQYRDIVVLDDPTGQTPMLIKRVIAVGGQTVDLRDGKVFVDGTPLDEPYTYGQPSLPGDPAVTYPVKLPPDTVWVMGDNRTKSKDSRWIGPQPFASVHGKAFVIYWPPSRWGSLND